MVRIIQTMGYRKRRDKSICPQGVPKVVGWLGERHDSTKGYRRRMDELISPQGILEMACLGRGLIPSATKEETS